MKFLTTQSLFFISILFLPINLTFSGILILVLLIKELYKNNFRIKINNLEINKYTKKYFLFFLLYSLIQGVFTQDILLNYAGLIGHYISYLLLFFFLDKAITKEIEVKKIIFYLSLSGVILSIVGFLAYLGFNPKIQLFPYTIYGGKEYLINLSTLDIIEPEYVRQRASGFNMNPNIMGCYFIFTIFLSILGLQLNKKDKIKNNIKYFLITSIFIQSLCLILSKSRGSIISFLLGIVLLSTFYPKLRKLVIFSFPLILFPILLNYDKYLVLVDTLGNFSTYGPNIKRIYTWINSFKIIKDYPLGVGILSFEKVFDWYLKPNQVHLPHAHNWYIQTMVESGVAGFLLFFRFYFSIIADFIKKLSKNHYLIPIILICFSIFSLTDYTLSDTRIGLLFTITIFIGFYLKKENNNNHN